MNLTVSVYPIAEGPLRVLRYGEIGLHADNTEPEQ